MKLYYRKKEIKKCLVNKYCYTKKEALTARNARKKKGAILRIYHCPFCNSWHLTKHEKH